MRSLGGVLDSVLFSQQLGFLHRGEQLNVQEFIPEPAVERFHESVLPRWTWCDVGRISTAPGTPLLQGVGDEFRAIVHPQMGLRWIELEQLLDRVDHLSSPAAPADSNGQAEAAVLIGHTEELESPPTHRLVEMDVDQPDVMWILSS